MDAKELNRKALLAGVPRAIMEKDYVLSALLFGISNSPLASTLSFKGGTALKKIYFPNARFSEDLDFSVLSGSESEITSSLKKLFENKETSGIRFMEIERISSRAGLRLAIKYVSMLNQVQRIRFDFSFRENLAAKPQEMELIDNHGFGKGKLLAMPLEELFAEKIHALASRVAPRDLYDVWFLLKNGIELNKAFVERKYSYYNEKYDVEKLEGKLEGFREKWNQDLHQFMAKVPDFDLLSKEAIALLMEKSK